LFLDWLPGESIGLVKKTQDAERSSCQSHPRMDVTVDIKSVKKKKKKKE
jgi:hypothetical protein